MTKHTSINSGTVLGKSQSSSRTASMGIRGLVASLLCVAQVTVSADLCPHKRCVFELTIDRIRSRTWNNPDDDGELYNVGLNETNGNLILIPNIYRQEGTDPLLGQTIDVEDTVTVGGVVKDVITVNGGIPGPVIEVMEGAEVGCIFYPST